MLTGRRQKSRHELKTGMWGRLPDKLKLKHLCTIKPPRGAPRRPRGLFYFPSLIYNIEDPLSLNHRRGCSDIRPTTPPKLLSLSATSAQLISPYFLRSMEVTTGHLNG
jgi:hypothetical protein